MVSISERTTKQRLEELRGYGFYLVSERVSKEDAEKPVTENHGAPVIFFPDDEYEMVIDRVWVKASRYDHLMDRWHRSVSTGIGRERHPLLSYLETRTTPWVIEQLAKPLSGGEPAREVEVGKGVIKVVREGTGITYELELQLHRIIVGNRRLRSFSRKITIYDFLLPDEKYTPGREE